MGKILVIGSVNMDMVIKTERLPKLGETLSGSGFSCIAGGKGANQAAAAAKLGGDVTFLGCVGNDIYADRLTDYIADSGAKAEISRVGTSSGVAVITVCGGDNHIIIDHGANYLLTPEIIESNRKLIEQAEFVVMQLEIPMESVEYAAALAKKGGARVVLNPSPFTEISNSLLKNTDLLIVNEFEASQLADCEISGKAAMVMDILERKTGGGVIVTMGKDGSVYRSNGELRAQKIFSVPVVDTTAAGDCFLGGVCACLSRGYGMERAVTVATAASAIAVSRLGAGTSIPTEEEVLSFLKTH